MSDQNSEAVLSDPNWLPHRYDEATDTIRFVKVDRRAHAKATFITDEYLTGTDKFVPVPATSIDRKALGEGAVHFVFHSAYCCSTLVARMFDAPGISMGFKEPVILNDLVGWRRRGAEPRALAARLDLAIALLSRPFDQGEAAIIKPSNIVNSLAPAMLGLRPDARALLLYAPIDDFLASIAVKGLWGRRWVRQALWGQMRDGVVVQQFSQEELFELTDLQIAGLGWLSHHAIYAQMIARFGSERVVVCDSRSLLEDKGKTVSAAFRHFGMPLAKGRCEDIAAGPAFTTNSKDRSSYSAADRERQISNTREANSDEIAKVSEWVRAVADAAGLDPAPPPSLLR